MYANTYFFEGTYPTSPTPPAGMQKHCIYRGGAEFPFLHDTSVSVLGGRLFAAWYQCTAGEIEGCTRIAGMWSDDGGESWSDLEVVACDPAYHCVPAAFYESEQGIFALVTRMTGHDRPVDVCEYTYVGGQWQLYRTHPIRFLFNTAPLRLPAGTYIAGGRVAAGAGMLPQIPAAAVRDADGNWTVEEFPGVWQNGEYPLDYPETALTVDHQRITAISRNDAEGGKQPTFVRQDGSWQATGEAELPINGVKMYAGVLQCGKEFLIFSEITPADDRSKLVMAVRDGYKGGYTRLHLIAQGLDAKLACGPLWHYPCAVEKDGLLYLSCTANEEESRRDAALFVIPVESL